MQSVLFVFEHVPKNWIYSTGIQNSLICFYEKNHDGTANPKLAFRQKKAMEAGITRCKKSSNQISKWNTDIQNVPLNLIPKTR